MDFDPHPEVPLDRATDLARAIEWRRSVSHRRHRVTSVKHHTGYEVSTGGRHQINQPPAHAKAYDAQASVIDLPVIFQESNGSIDVVDDRRVAQARFPCRTIVFTVRTTAVVKVRRHRGVSLKRDHAGAVLDKVFQTRLTANHDEPRHRLAALPHA